MVCAILATVSLAACSLDIGGSGSGGSGSEGDTSSGPSRRPRSRGAWQAHRRPPRRLRKGQPRPSRRGECGTRLRRREIPPVPMFTLPDLSLLTESSDMFTPDLTQEVDSVPGVSVGPARCEEPGVLASGSGHTVLGGDGSAVTSSEGSSTTNNGDGSGAYSDPTVTITNNGDGSGTYSDPTVTITSNGDGSGTYSDPTLSVTVNGDGSGTYADAGVTITNNGDGSGTYSDPTVTITNNGDGSGTYSDATLSITNSGDGTALVASPTATLTVDADPLPQVGKVGSFPSIDAIQPVTSCGTLITLEDRVLFDFGSSEVRDDASQTLGNLAEVLTSSGAPAIQVHGHTDSVSDEAFNQTLSEERAQAVVEELASQGVTASMEATGYGETQPVASNENEDGSDNPAGRQLNRRVEVFIPAF
ncbi:OmpA family protein [Actinomyces lilanjuaniae]|uniref:OmpA family protein n=2 Tax=Actinomyces lilanjuaniae TaxID=2321394 RepID=A0ABM6Z5F5_9ACTO|nr:OmpA family protein [Actinomyces lilanjuaniae]